VIAPGDGPTFSVALVKTRTGKAGTNDGVIRGCINDQNCWSSVDFHSDQDQPEQATVFEGNFL